MKFRIGGRKFTAEWAEFYVTPKIEGLICILRSGDRIYSGVSIQNPVDEYNGRVGSVLALRRALYAAHLGERCYHSVTARLRVNQLLHDYRRELWEADPQNEQNVILKIVGEFDASDL